MNQDRIRPNAWVVNLNSRNSVIVGIVLLQHVLCNVRDVLSRIGFSSDVHIPASQVESSHEVLPEPGEISPHIDLVVDLGWSSRGSRAETGSNRLRTRSANTAGRERAQFANLINIHHVGQVDEAEGVGLGFECSALPQKWSMFLEQAVQRTATRAAIEPDRDLVGSIHIVRREEPKVELILICLVAIDRECASVGFSDVERNARDC